MRVTSPQATKDELLALLDDVEVPEERTLAPRVEVDGLELVGSVDVPGLVGARASARAHSDAVPGPTEAHGVGWTRTDADHLAVSRSQVGPST